MVNGGVTVNSDKDKSMFNLEVKSLPRLGEHPQQLIMPFSPKAFMITWTRSAFTAIKAFNNKTLDKTPKDDFFCVKLV